MKEQKKALRRDFLAKRRALSKAELATSDRELTSNILSLPEYKEAELILLYASEKGEPDTYALAKAAMADGKRLAYPRCNADRTMDFLICTPSELTPGFHSIPEPPSGAKKAEPTEKTLCIVPAVLFDREGFRIGYGGGFYDRFLADFRGVTVGLARDGFLLESLPRENFDLPCNIIITQKDVIRCR